MGSRCFLFCAVDHPFLVSRFRTDCRIDFLSKGTSEMVEEVFNSTQFGRLRARIRSRTYLEWRPYFGPKLRYGHCCRLGYPEVWLALRWRCVARRRRENAPTLLYFARARPLWAAGYSFDCEQKEKLCGISACAFLNIRKSNFRSRNSQHDRRILSYFM